MIDRADFLSATCTDGALRSEVNALLSAHEGAGAFLQSPAVVDAGLIGADETVLTQPINVEMI